MDRINLGAVSIGEDNIAPDDVVTEEDFDDTVSVSSCASDGSWSNEPDTPLADALNDLPPDVNGFFVYLQESRREAERDKDIAEERRKNAEMQRDAAIEELARMIQSQVKIDGAVNESTVASTPQAQSKNAAKKKRQRENKKKVTQSEQHQEISQNEGKDGNELLFDNERLRAEIQSLEEAVNGYAADVPELETLKAHLANIHQIIGTSKPKSETGVVLSDVSEGTQTELMITDYGSEDAVVSRFERLEEREACFTKDNLNDEVISVEALARLETKNTSMEEKILSLKQKLSNAEEKITKLLKTNTSLKQQVVNMTALANVGRDVRTREFLRRGFGRSISATAWRFLMSKGNEAAHAPKWRADCDIFLMGFWNWKTHGEFFLWQYGTDDKTFARYMVEWTRFCNAKVEIRRNKGLLSEGVLERVKILQKTLEDDGLKKWHFKPGWEATAGMHLPELEAIAKNSSGSSNSEDVADSSHG